MRRVSFFVALAILFLVAKQSYAQSLLNLEEILNELIDEGKGADAEMGLEYLEELYNSPIAINSANERELRRLFFLSDFMIANIIDYREKFGDITSKGELELIGGFNERVVNLMAPFITFDKGSLRGGENSLYIRTSKILKEQEWYKPISIEEFERFPNSRYLGTSYHTLLKYKGSYRGKYGYGVTIENDYGEKSISKEGIPFGDFASAYFSLSNLSISKKLPIRVDNLIIGDYSIRFGQGLAVWNGFAFSSATSPSGLCKRGSLLQTYSSTNENNFFRGGAMAIGSKIKDGVDLKIIPFLSYKNIDARVKDGGYTSIIEGGKHNTISTLETRKSMGSLSYGARGEISCTNYAVGVNTIFYKYEFENNRAVREYNKYTLFNGLYGNYSIDFNGIFSGKRLFGEVALDYKGAVALMAGVNIPVKRDELGIVFFNYSKKYISPYSNSIGCVSGTNNQVGGVVNYKFSNKGGREWLFSLQGAYFPWLRYRVDKSSFQIKGSVKMDFDINNFSGYGVLKYGYDSGFSRAKINVRGVVNRAIGEKFKIGLRGEFIWVDYNSVGYCCALDFVGGLLNGKLKMQARGLGYNVDSWDTRVYIYTPDLPSSYTSKLLYKGCYGWLFMANYKIAKRVALYCKIDNNMELKLGVLCR